ncbi:MAG: Sel1 domain protein repeat-containing protein [Cyanobacteria bacterium RYN_339]|nr:Sel1 domain protein repeat-containing protein [Cyanobacteria bacterium RYN_339]
MLFFAALIALAGAPDWSIISGDELRHGAEQGIPAAQHEWAQAMSLDDYSPEGMKPDVEAQFLAWEGKSADQGYGPAFMGVVNHYRATNRYAQAIPWLRRGAEAGYAECQRKFGTALEEGEETAKDEAAALGWYRKAAAQGDMEAEASLGECLFYGHGGPADEKSAVVHLRTAANHLQVTAGRILASAYAEGRGVKQDDVEAYFWAMLEWGANEPLTQQLAARLAPAQRDAVQARVDAYLRDLKP